MIVSEHYLLSRNYKIIVDEVEVKTIPGFPDYAVSEDGRVYANSRRDILNRTLRARWIKEYNHNSGYPFVWMRVNGKAYLKKISRLVLQAWVGPCPSGMECRHLDGNKKNSRLEDLTWGTHQENIDDKKTMGTMARGERQGLSKLKKPDIQNIRFLYRTGRFRYKDLAFQFDVSISTIWQVVKGVTWNHLKLT